MKDFLKSTLFKVLCGVAAFFVGMMIYAATTNVGTITGAVLTPIQNGFTAVVNAVENLFSGIGSSSRLAEENEQLRSQINTLREQQVELDELRRQNDFYKSFLGLKEQNPDYRFTAACVIASDPSDIYGNFTINAGTLSDVSVGCAVITPEGLCGVVTEVGLNYAYVRTLLDPEVQISAYDSRTREDGLTAGSVELARAGQLRLTQLERSDTAAAGDYVVTYGGSYPEGLLIGEILEISPASDGLSKYAVVRPFADIHALSNVFVITSFEKTEGAG